MDLGDGFKCFKAVCRSSFLGSLQSQSLALFEGLLQSALHVECGFGVVVSLAFQQGCEAFDGVLELYELALPAGEDLAHEEGLGQELLDLPGPGHSQLVVFRELVHPQNGDDVLKGFVVLQQFLHASGHCVVTLSDDGGVQHTGG